MENIIQLKDQVDTRDKLAEFLAHRGGPKKTEIKIFENGKLTETVENKIVITGSVFNAINVYGIQSPIIFPNYNEELGLQNTLDYTTVSPKNAPIICLFCVDDSGCGASPNEVYTVNYIDRISPDTIMPFRYVSDEDDLSDDLRKYYFGRKELEDGKVGYYFKRPSTEPKLNVRYADGTQIIGESVYNVDSDQIAEVFVEMNLNISREDFRDYFDQVLGWDKARVSSLSLCYAWYDDDLDPNRYKWYQQIIPMTKLNFSFRLLAALDASIRFQYRIYF